MTTPPVDHPSLAEQQKKVDRSRFMSKVTVSIAVIAIAISLMLSQIVQINYTTNLRGENTSLRRQLSSFQDESDCRSQIIADFDTAWSDMDRLIAEALIAVTDNDTVALQDMKAELQHAIQVMRENQFRRQNAVELCSTAAAEAFK